MTVLSDYVARMVEGGMEQTEAMQIVAEVFAAGVANASVRSTGAARQQRYRDRKTVTKRNETVTTLRGDEASRTVTDRNESVTPLRSPLSIERKISKDSKREKRATQLPDDWKPDEGPWLSACDVLGGTEAAEKELRKFRNHAAEKGRVSKRWNAAWANWIDRAVDWKAPNQRAGPSAKPLTEFQLKQRATNDVRQKLRDSADAARCRGEADRTLSGDHGERPGNLRGGAGPYLLSVPRTSGGGGVGPSYGIARATRLSPDDETGEGLPGAALAGSLPDE